MRINISSNELRAERITLVGGVQGFGIRPAIARLAYELQLRGTVCNAMQGVVVELEGNSQALGEFRERVSGCLPQQAQVRDLVSEPMQLVGFERFEIIRSDPNGKPNTEVPVDLRICDRCLAELRDPSNRRFGYAFTSCTDCGPRYSILYSMPYDRERTSMKQFKMCEVCSQEYSSPMDRRYHSQTNCCRECGPTIWFSSSETNVLGEMALELAASLLRQGGILAMKGLGGYQLLCDATNNDSVERLRERKRRATKPFAVMVDTQQQVDDNAILSNGERQAIASAAGPIVLLEARVGNGLAKSIHPGLNTIGMMLPTTAIHAILLDQCKVPLVVTSGNLEGEPIEYRLDTANRNLSVIADGFLHHNREVLCPVDDSVARCMNDRVVTIRAARGLTPFATELQSDALCIAVGGQQKASIAITNGQRGVLGPHLGDLESVAGRERFHQHATDLQRLYSVQPTSIAHDMHPDYSSTRWAQASGNHCHAVQHHHAHVVAGMLEHGWLDQTVLGVAFDGTGWGENGLIQGGEILMATSMSFNRIGSLRAFPLLGGEAAIRDPNRVALALLKDSIETKLDEAIDLLRLRTPDTTRNFAMLEDRRWSPLTTSVGRLFDGVAALLLERTHPLYEGELAMQLESICDHRELGSYPFEIVETFDGASRLIEIDWRSMMRGLYDDRRQSISIGRVAMRLHRGLANAIAAFVDRFPGFPVVLSGGVFQNRALVELLEPLLSRSERIVGWPGRIPPNDGGLSIGQLAIAVTRQQNHSAFSKYKATKERICV